MFHLQNPEENQLLVWFSWEVLVLFFLIVIGGNKQKFETFQRSIMSTINLSLENPVHLNQDFHLDFWRLSEYRLRGGTQRHNLKEESLGFLEKTQTFEKSLLRDNNLVEFFFPSRLNDPDEQNRLPIGYLFATRWAMTLPSPTGPPVIGLPIIFFYFLNRYLGKNPNKPKNNTKPTIFFVSPSFFLAIK